MKFRIPREDALQIQLTPLIDVVFLLLLFFMLTATFSELNFLDVQLPRADAESAVAGPRIDLGIDASGDIYLNGQLLPPDDDFLEQRLRTAVQMQPDAQVFVHAHAQTPHEAVARVMARARAQGISELHIATLSER